MQTQWQQAHITRQLALAYKALCTQQPELWIAVVHTAATEGVKPTKSQKAASQRSSSTELTAADVRRLRDAPVVQLSSAEHARRLALVTQQYTAYKQSIRAAVAAVAATASAAAANAAVAEQVATETVPANIAVRV